MAKLTMKQFEKKLKNWAKDNPDAIRNALKAGAETVRTEAVVSHLSGPKMPRGVGSAKRATLQPRTGDLRGSINTKVSVGKKISAQVGTNIKYAGVHEYGIGKMPKRPFLQPSLEEKREEVLQLITDRIMEAYRKA